ncbi:MAG: bifunctional 23S rRNA (guanine(2069)-N(7))-methyltransferase RlmK/23S rRNA (guanine(2445)-N(2))-methyltransferase RlmL [Legionellaceae bacterium]|nr:bifunctional 23S rRNA (guanine(2069)-N(7))-methyltransferase RlmK/23S rRNA (guanine(2445)-N(2))-methyltransferase RlmL [Legionellaceae bacterium]
MKYSLFVSCPKGLEYLLETEVRALGLQVERVSPQGVFGEASLSTLYQLCLWSRLANRVQLLLFHGPADTPAALQQVCRQFDWQTVFSADKRFSVEFHGSSAQFRNAMFGAQIIKDGIVDYFRGCQQPRPNVDKQQPDIRIHAYLRQDSISVSLDLCGYSLHQRGYRQQAGQAPLKENLAAALLIRANWPQLATQGYALADPFCGSGTLVIEAAMMAANMAPGLLRQDQALSHWYAHQPPLWEQLRLEAQAQITPVSVPLYGSDQDGSLIHMAIDNAQHAGVADVVDFQQASLSDWQARAPKALLITNPPYGERMGDISPLIRLYQQLGQTLHQQGQGWQAAILTSNPLLAKAIGLRSDKQYRFYNGPIACKLYQFHIGADNRLHTEAPDADHAPSSMLANRLRKNWQHLKKWAKRHAVEAFRIYDADLPDYAFAVDWYQGYAVVQEYAPPADIPPHKAEKRRLEMMRILPSLLDISPTHVILKERKRQKGLSQYEKLDKRQIAITIQEGCARLKVNLSDYLDTGLFLDHRPIRLQFANLKTNSRFLNCFCYTASASVHAALAGAFTTNVDLSKTYLNWAEENFRLNELDPHRHQFIQYDCLEWLERCTDSFDTIFLDPPSFSNSKRMRATLDIQRDHVSLIRAAMKRLNPGGQLFFSTNLRSFSLDPSLSADYKIQDISAASIPEDFKRRPNIHRCYRMESSS